MKRGVATQHSSVNEGRVLRSRCKVVEDTAAAEPKAPRTPLDRSSAPKRNTGTSIVVPASSSSSASRSESSFLSCLSQGDIERDDYVDSSPKGMRPVLLRRALSIQELDDDSWLSSSLIDLVIGKFSKAYTRIHFMSIDFVVLSLKNKSFQGITDISGRVINYRETTPIVFIVNNEGIHWQCVRVVRGKDPRLELFEPMGKPEHRHGGLGSRDLPRCVIEWLDHCCPFQGEAKKSWLTLGVSAITERQQLNSHDCGVAALLYAERCGLGHTAEDINTVRQTDISAYRQLLKGFTMRVQELD